MESLLRWSIEHSSPQDANAPVQPRTDLDPGIIDLILGKPDAEQMKDDMAIATDASKSEDERLDALDHLEMLIEQIDNANNLEKLKMWEPLHALLTSDSSTHDLILQTLWVIGTALQNNPAAQESYLSLQPIPTLLSFLAPSASTPQVRSKLIYALSGLLKHNKPALEALGEPESDGWNMLKSALQDPDISVRRKTAFLFNTLLTPSLPDPSSAPSTTTNGTTIHANSHASHLAHPERTTTSPLALKALKEHGILDSVIDSVANPQPYGLDGEMDEVDPDFEEKSARLLKTYAVDCNADFDSKQKASLNKWLDEAGKRPGNEQGTLATRLGFGQDELREFSKKLQ